MAKKTKVAAASAGAYGAARQAAENPYVQRLVEDEDLRDNLRTAYDSARKAFHRMNGKGPVRAIADDKKVQKELREAAHSLREAADTLRGAKAKRRKRRPGRLLLIALLGGGAALVLSEGLRKKVLDALFGAEEEFEYTSSTTPASSSQPVGTSS